MTHNREKEETGIKVIFLLLEICGKLVNRFVGERIKGLQFKYMIIPRNSL